MKSSILLSISVAALISSSVAQGFEIYWDTTGIEDAASVNASIGGEEVDFTDSEGFDLLIDDVDIDLVKGNGLTLESGYSDGYVTSGWNGGGSDYLEFTITPGAGESINFEYAAELLIDLQTDISLFQFQLYSSLDGYTSPVATSDTYPFDPSDLSDENTFQSSQFLDLSTLGVVSEPVTLRIVQSSGGTGSVGVFAYNDTMGILNMLIRRNIVESGVFASFSPVVNGELVNGNSEFQVSIGTSTITGIENIPIGLLENTSSPDPDSSGWTLIEGGYDSGSVIWNATTKTFTAQKPGFQGLLSGYLGK
jgi:hypothetical protein